MSYFTNTAYGSIGVNSIIPTTGALEIYHILPEAIAFEDLTFNGIMPTGSPVWQAFISPINGLLTEVYLDIEVIPTITPTTFYIWAGIGTGGTVLYSQPNITFQIGSGAFRLTTPFPLIVNQTYTIGSIAGSTGFNAAFHNISPILPYTNSSLVTNNIINNSCTMIQRDPLLFINNTANPSISIGSTTPTISGSLDINTTTGSLIVPRMTTFEKDALTASDGMIVYDINLAAFQFRKAGAWVSTP